jgi:hypothetical protein
MMTANEKVILKAVGKTIKREREKIQANVAVDVQTLTAVLERVAELLERILTRPRRQISIKHNDGTRSILTEQADPDAIPYQTPEMID